MSKRLDEFGDRMKSYESHESLRTITTGLPVYVRLDGRSFSRFTAGLPRPYDPKISWAMKATAEELIRQFKCDVAYTQSDEISLGWRNPNESEFLFSGRIQKLVSILAGVASAVFNQKMLALGGEYATRARRMVPAFDARLFQVPDIMELTNAFLWRAQDCRKNSISMLAQSYFSHKTLQNKNALQMREMLAECGIDAAAWENNPDFFRYGTYLQRVLRNMPMPDDVPEKFRTSDTVIRSRIVRLKKQQWQTTEEMMYCLFSEKEEEAA